MRPLRFRHFAAMAISFLTACAVSPALADMTYTVTDLGVFPGGSSSVATGINSSGQIVGWADISSTDSAGNPESRAFLYKGTGLINLGVLSSGSSAGENSYAYAINDAGQVVGASHIGLNDAFFANPIFHAFSYNTGALTDLGTLGGDNSYAYGINAFGTIVGQADNASDINTVAFMVNSSGLSAITGLGSLDSQAYTLNSKNQIVGWATTASYYQEEFLSSGGGSTTYSGFPTSVATSISENGLIVGGYSLPNPSVPTDPFFHACQFTGSSVTDLGTLGGSRSNAECVNYFGLIVGWADRQSTGTPQAFVWQSGVLRNLNDLVPVTSPLVLETASGINNSGQITGYGADSNNHTHAFLLTPFLMFSVAYVTGGNTTTATITLDSPAPTGGAIVLISSDSALATPAVMSVTIPAGATTATFSVLTTPVSADTVVHLTATYNGSPRQAPLLIRPTTSISGTISLEACVNVAGTPITFVFRPTDASASFSRTVNLTASGTYSIANIPAGTYNLAIKGAIWLQKVLPLDTTSGPVANVSTNLLTGDANNDNSVDTTDFNVLVGAYGSDSSKPGSGYDAQADFNCDGKVDTGDFNLLVGNFGVQGQP